MLKSQWSRHSKSNRFQHRPAAIIRKGIFTVAILGASSASGAPSIGDIQIAPSGPTNAGSVFLSPLHAGVTGLLVSTESNCSGAIYRPVSQPIEYVLPNHNGWNYFYTRTTTDSGEGSDCVAQEVLHDDQSPIISSLAGPSDYTADSSAMISFVVGDGLNGSGVEKLECSLNSQAWVECASPVQLEQLSEGEQRFQVRAVDFANNGSGASEIAWSVDLSDPTVSIQGPPDDNGFVHFAGDDGAGGSGVVRFVCSLDARSSVDCVSPFSVGISAPGSHSLTVMAIDKVGRSSNEERVDWIVSEPPPALDLRIVGVSGPQDGNVDEFFLGTRAPWINLAISGELGSMKVMIVDHSGKKICSREGLLPEALVKLPHLCRLRNGEEYTAMAEAVGPKGSVTASFKFVADVKRPDVDVKKAYETESGSVAIPFAIKDETPIVVAECSLQGPKGLRIERNCAGQNEMHYTGLTEGKYTFLVRATDSVGLSQTKALVFFNRNGLEGQTVLTLE